MFIRVYIFEGTSQAEIRSMVKLFRERYNTLKAECDVIESKLSALSEKQQTDSKLKETMEVKSKTRDLNERLMLDGITLLRNYH